MPNTDTDLEQAIKRISHLDKAQVIFGCLTVVFVVLTVVQL